MLTLIGFRTGVSKVSEGQFCGRGPAGQMPEMNSQDTSQLANLVRRLGRGLNDQGKERFVSHLAAIAVADGSVSHGERAVLDSVGSGLAMSSAHLLGIVTAVENTPRL